MNPDKEKLPKDVRKKLKKLLTLGYVFNIYKVPPKGEYYLILRTPEKVIHGTRHFKTREELITIAVNHLL